MNKLQKCSGKMIFYGSDDSNQLKTRRNSLKLMETGIPEDSRAYLGMMGFRVTINAW